MVKVSVLMPCHNEAEAIQKNIIETVSTLKKSNNGSFELIVVDDGSSDNTFDEILAASECNNCVKSVQLNRNYGKGHALKKGFEDNAPKAVVEIMHRATDNLSNSGILERTIKVGEKAPNFSLKNGNGEEISLKALLSKGPLVLTFYRGRW